MSITDIVPTLEFIKDYDDAPRDIREKMDVWIEKILKAQRYPNSLRPHKVYSTNLMSGYITTTGAHWRILFEEVGSVMYLHRLLNHDKYDVYIKSIGKGK